jgi:5-methylcytosine-specific restriction endonuclease McrA
VARGRKGEAAERATPNGFLISLPGISGRKTRPMIPYSGPIVTRAEAKTAGLKRYFTGIPCHKGHLVERHVSSDECVVCRKAQKDREYAKYREKYLARGRAYYSAHKAGWREYAVKNRGHINALRAKRRERDGDRINAVQREWMRRNREKIRKYKIAEYWNNRPRMRAYQAKYYRTNPLPFKQRANKRRLLLSQGAYTEEDIRSLFQKQKGKCAICFKKLLQDFHIDHIKPLARGGADALENVQLTHPLCNFRKKAKDPIDFARELGRLL